MTMVKWETMQNVLNGCIHLIEVDGCISSSTNIIDEYGAEMEIARIINANVIRFNDGSMHYLIKHINGSWWIDNHKQFYPEIEEPSEEPWWC